MSSYLRLDELVGLLDVPQHDEHGPLHRALADLREEEVVRHDALGQFNVFTIP